MPTVNTAVLIIGHPQPQQGAVVGASFAGDEAQARTLMQQYRFAVLVFSSDLAATEQMKAFLDFLDQNHSQSLRVLVHQTGSGASLTELINRGRVFSVLPDFIGPDFETGVQEALEAVRLDQQNDQLFELVQEQNTTLTRLSVELEDRVHKRQNFLMNARQRLLTTSQQLSALHRALVAVHRASSTGEMEKLLNEALAQTLYLSWIRVQFRSQHSGHFNRLDLAKMYSLFKAELDSDQGVAGEIYFARDLDRPFSKDEKSFLLQVSDAVSLAIDRISKLEILESLKGQWQATFDSISHPLTLVDSDYLIFRTNKAFVEQTKSVDNVVGRKCYEALFGRSAPCVGCRLGTQFRLQHVRTQAGSDFTFQVDSQLIRLDNSDRALFVSMYRDVTEQQRLERQILESAKLAELGIIGSSIAHEINNPLGGMISFLQLIKMDLKGDESYYTDIVEMEDGAQRCKDIVQNLLGFTRKSESSQSEDLDLRDVITRSLKITELQTRSKGIQVELDVPKVECLIHGHVNLLSQALCNLLQNATEAIHSRTQQEPPGFRGQIEVRLHEQDDQYVLEISDNGIGIPAEFLNQVMAPHYTTKDGNAVSGLGLAVANQIISDHHGHLTINSELDTTASAAPGRKTVARLTFSRPVLG